MPAKVLPDAEEFARFTEALVRHGHGRARRFAQQASALALRSDGARDGKSVVLRILCRRNGFNFKADPGPLCLLCDIEPELLDKPVTEVE